jgi:ferritin-like metal-binding protein YciE
MRLLSLTFNTLQELFMHELKDIYDAENRIVEALPKMAEAANSAELKNAFRQHLNETQTHITRLERVFRSLGEEPARETCDGIKGVLSEGSDAVSAKGDPAVHDAALIAAAQRVEHYEMAVYGTLRSFAEQLGHNEAATTFQQTLDEEEETDKKLTELAESRINVVARH